MKPFILSLLGLFLCLPIQSANVDPETLREVPAGNYLLNIERIGTADILINLEVKDGKAVCVKANEPSFEKVQGQFQTLKSGVFAIRLSNGVFQATQVWIFRKDGSAAIREQPDRGELQRAVLVKGETLTFPR